MNKLNEHEKKIVTSHAFAQILSATLNDSGFAELSYCPLQLLNNNQLLGHLANNNPLIKAAKTNAQVKAIFSGPHGYISPRWHSEQVVPTWNYATVSLTCTLNFIDDIDKKLAAMKTLSNYFDPQWNFNTFDRNENHVMVERMLTAITVFNLEITHVESRFKLSQQRSLECRKAFQENLRLTGYQALADIQLL